MNRNIILCLPQIGVGIVSKFRGLSDVLFMVWFMVITFSSVILQPVYKYPSSLSIPSFFPEELYFLFTKYEFFGSSAVGFFWVGLGIISSSLALRGAEKLTPYFPDALDLRRQVMSDGEKYLRDNNIRIED